MIVTDHQPAMEEDIAAMAGKDDPRENTAGAAMLFIDFGKTGTSQDVRGEGWSGQEADSVWAIGSRSTLTLPDLPASQTFIVEVDVNPCLALPSIHAQFLAVRANGHALGWQRVTGPSRIRCRIPPDLRAGAGLVITFEHPGFVRGDLLGTTKDNRPLAIRFFGLRLYPETPAAAIDRLRPLRPHALPLDLYPPGSPEAEQITPNRTIHEFGPGKTGAAGLREGWYTDPDGQVWTAAPSCHLELPAPDLRGRAGPGPHSLRIALAPLTVQDLLPAQRLAVILGGMLLGQFRLATETVLSFALPPGLMEASLGDQSQDENPSLRLTLLVPNALPMRQFAYDHPGHALGFALDWIGFERTPLRQRLAAMPRGDDLDILPPLAMSDRFLDLPADALKEAITAELGSSPADLMRGFESLGDNCAFGLAQRKAGAEILGLLRFANTPLRALLRGMADAFKAATAASEIELYLHPAEPREYMLRIPRYGIHWHTMVHEPDAEAATVAREQTMKLGFLRRKFTEGLRSGRKIYTLARSEPRKIAVAMPGWDAPPVATDDQGPLQLFPVWDAPQIYEGMPAVLYLAEALSVLLELNQAGTNTLLYFVPCTGGRRAGTVELLSPGLMRGYMSSFVTLANQETPNDLDWVRVAANAWLLNREANAMSLLTKAA
jgi:hypothetical protein